MVDKGSPFIGLTIVIRIGPDDYISITITIHIPCTGNTVAKIGSHLIAFYLSVNCGVHPAS